VNDWPTIWKYLAVLVASPWLPLTLSVLFAGLWFGLRKEPHEKEVSVTQHETPVALQVQGAEQPDLGDPSYDYLWQTPEERVRAKLDVLIKTGQILAEQWTTRLDYPEKQGRENDSKNWLCEGTEFARKHLTSEQVNKFSLHHQTEVSGSKRYDFAMALTQAGTEPSSDDGDLAFQILGKLKVLERFRSEPC
jgi:hypothetical protein